MIEIRPIEKKRWHGATYASCPITFSVPINPTTLRYDVGLTDAEVIEYSKLVGVDLTPIYNASIPHPYWDTTVARLKLEDKTTILNPDSNIHDKLKSLWIPNCKYIAPSLEKSENGEYPHALFYVYNKTKEDEVKATKIAMRNKAVLELSKTASPKKIDIIMVLLGENTKSSTMEYLDMKLDECIEKHGAEKVLSVLHMDGKQLSLKVMILEGLQRNVIRREGSSIYYMDIQMGFDVEDAVSYLSNPDNQKLYAVLMERINA